MPKEITLLSEKHIENLIFMLRNEKIVIDRDIAKLYGVTTKALNQAVNATRKDFRTNLCFN